MFTRKGFGFGHWSRHLSQQRPISGALVSSNITTARTVPIWKPPILGVNPAYDEALRLIALNKQEKLDDIKVIDTEIAQLTKDPKSGSTVDIAELQKRRFKLRVEAEINNPEVQWNFKNGIAVDMSQPVYRYMRQQQFETDVLPVLMERITQMNILPDLLPPSFIPSVELGIHLNNSQKAIEPGHFVDPLNTFDTPVLTATCFHEEVKLYTLLMVDPDVPDQENLTYQQQCHWLITNVPLSSGDSSITNKGNIVLPYLPPHPAKGSAKYHRYAIILFEQSNEGKENMKIDEGYPRLHFDVAKFQHKHNFTPRGINFFREKWDETVSTIYKKLGIYEPIFGPEPRASPYLDGTGIKRRRYIAA